MINFVSDLRQIGGFLRVPPVSSTNINDRHDITEILLKVALNTISLTRMSIRFKRLGYTSTTQVAFHTADEGVEHKAKQILLYNIKRVRSNPVDSL